MTRSINHAIPTGRLIKLANGRNGAVSVGVDLADKPVTFRVNFHNQRRICVVMFGLQARLALNVGEYFCVRQYQELLLPKGFNDGVAEKVKFLNCSNDGC